MNNILQSLLSVLMCVTIVYVFPVIAAAIHDKIDEIEHNQLLSVVDNLVRAAEQLLRANDPTGEKRKQWVQEQLVQLDIEITDLIDAMIEAAVYKLGHTK